MSKFFFLFVSFKFFWGFYSSFLTFFFLDFLVLKLFLGVFIVLNGIGGYNR